MKLLRLHPKHIYALRRYTGTNSKKKHMLRTSIPFSVYLTQYCRTNQFFSQIHKTHKTVMDWIQFI